MVEFHISSINLEEGVTPTIKDRDFTIATIAPPTVMKVEEEKPATEEESSSDSEEAKTDTEVKKIQTKVQRVLIIMMLQIKKS